MDAKVTQSEQALDGPEEISEEAQEELRRAQADAKRCSRLVTLQRRKLEANNATQPSGSPQLRKTLTSAAADDEQPETKKPRLEEAPLSGPGSSLAQLPALNGVMSARDAVRQMHQPTSSPIAIAPSPW